MGNAVGNAATKTDDAIDGAAKAVDETVSSTANMVADEETPELTRQRIDGVATETIAQLLASNPQAEVYFARYTMRARKVS